LKVIIVTGTPGTGKTLIAKKIAKIMNYKYLDVTKLIKKNKIFDDFDKKRKCYVIDTKKLNKFLISLIKKSKDNLVIDSHLSHFLPKKYVNLCIVTKCELKILKKRLQKRKYSKEKIKENLQSEIFDICLNEAKENKHKIIIFNTTNLKK